MRVTGAVGVTLFACTLVLGAGIAAAVKLLEARERMQPPPAAAPRPEAGPVERATREGRPVGDFGSSLEGLSK